MSWVADTGGPDTPREQPRKRVLVVDDDPYLRQTIAEVLALEGCAVAEAANGAAALAAVQEAEREPFDLILLDHNMPVMDGSAFVRAYREWCAARPGPHARIVCVTAATDAAAWCRQVKADGCLPKPFELDHLLACVEEPLHVHEPARA